MSLRIFPEELYGIILSNIMDFKTWFALRRTCKTFNEIMLKNADTKSLKVYKSLIKFNDIHAVKLVIPRLRIKVVKILLEFALDSGNISVVSFIIRHFGNLDKQILTKAKSLICRSILGGDVEMMKCLMTELDSSNMGTYTMGMIYEFCTDAIRNNNLPILKFITEKFNEKISYEALVKITIYNNRPDCLAHLLTSHNNINPVKCLADISSYEYFAENRCVEYIFKHCGNMAGEFFPELTVHLQHYNDDCVKMLLDACSGKNNTQSIKRNIRKRIFYSINFLGKGKTCILMELPLDHWLVAESDKNSPEYDARKNGLNSMFNISAIKGHLNIMQFLMTIPGAHIDVNNNNGLPIKLAVGYKHKDIIDYLGKFPGVVIPKEDGLYIYEDLFLAYSEDY